MRINWFTPLPPSPTDIANWSVTVLEGLTRRADVTVFANQKYRIPRHRDIGRVVSLTDDEPDWSALQAGNAINIYVLGNDVRYHDRVWDIAARCPGIIVSHDLNLHDFFLGYYRVRRQFDEYEHALDFELGTDGRALGRDLWAGSIDAAVGGRCARMLAWTARHALGLVVHGSHAREILPDRPLPPVLTANLPFDLGHPPPSLSEKHAGDGPIELAIFGYIGRNRGIAETFEALGGMDARARFRLNLMGTLWDEDEVGRLADNFGVADLVRVHGYLSTAKFTSLLSAMDLVINLRTPTMGESSGSQLRLMAHGLPSVVSRAGFWADLPGSLVEFVEPGEEVSGLRQVLAEYLADPAPFRAPAAARRQYVLDHHSVDDYVDRLLTFAADRAPMYRGLLGRRMLESAATELAALGLSDPDYHTHLVRRTMAEWADDIAGPAR